MPTERTRDVVVTPAGPEDWAVVRQLRLTALADAPEAFCATLEVEAALDDRAWQRRLEAADRTTLLARHDGEPVGMVLVGPWEEDGVAATAAIDSVWVAPAGRGLGVGDALVAGAVELARDRGYRRAVLEVGDHNLPAQRLYARHGFTRTGRTATMPPPKQHLTEHELARDL